MDDIKKKRGRPKSDKTRDTLVGARFSKEEDDMLREICFELEMSRTEVVRKAVKAYYHTLFSRRY